MLFFRLSIPLDFEAIKNELVPVMSGDWIAHVNARGYQGQWRVLALRVPAEAYDKHPVLQTFAIESNGQWCDLDVLKNCPALSAFLASFQCPVKSVRLMALAPGSHIKPHRDLGLAWGGGEARLHVPILSTPGVEFRVNGQRVPMQIGELWYINAGEEHEVINKSPHERIHLVIDCEINHWLLRCFGESESDRSLNSPVSSSV